MKIFFALLTLGMAVTTWSAEPAVRVIRVDDRAKNPIVIHHVVGGQAATLHLHMERSAAHQTAPVRASLYQFAGAIAAPVAKDIAVVPTEGTANSGRVVLDVPAVRRVTIMEVRFSMQEDDAGSWRPAGSVRLAVHPSDLLVQLTTLLAGAGDRGGKLFVIGDSPGLKSALRSASAVFEEKSADALPGTEGVWLTECDAPTAQALIDRTDPKTQLMVFTSDSTIPAGVYWFQRDQGFTARITIPILTDFARSPDRQAMLLTVLERALRTAHANSIQ